MVCEGFYRCLCKRSYVSYSSVLFCVLTGDLLSRFGYFVFVDLFWFFFLDILLLKSRGYVRFCIVFWRFFLILGKY